MAEEYGPDIITVLDDDGKEHQFEWLDAIETDEARYVALVPVFDDPNEAVADDGELIILRVEAEGDEEFLVQIEDPEEFDDIAEIFEERLEQFYEIDVIT